MAGVQVHRYRDDCSGRRPRSSDRRFEKYNNADDARRLCNAIYYRKRYVPMLLFCSGRQPECYHTHYNIVVVALDLLCTIETRRINIAPPRNRYVYVSYTHMTRR